MNTSRIKRAEEFVKKTHLQILGGVLTWKLHKFPFFHSVHTHAGKRRDYVIPNDGRTIVCDATYTCIIKDESGKAMSVIGFELSAEALYVYQLQGIKDADTRGVDLGDYLLAHTEVIARKLRKSYICVQPARLHRYYELDEFHDLYPQLYRHQARMRNIYDGGSTRRGYEYHDLGYPPRYQKFLRKRITFARWLRLQELLLDRRLRQHQREFPQDALFANE